LGTVARMKPRIPRLAVRAVILHEGRLLLVNAYSGVAPNGPSDLWCAPGGGVDAGSSLPGNLIREVHEETGLTVDVGPLVLVNEFHEPSSGFHQVELFFRCAITQGTLDSGWADPEGVVSERRFFSPAELRTVRLKPDSLPRIAFDPSFRAHYDPFELIVP
jgi:8-oxo-dGTP diphosphatase